ncbi:MAG: NUDIX domain-containing protein [Gemmatimonadales bacterium]
MPGRSSVGRAVARGLSIAVDIALFSPRANQLAVLLVADAARGRRERWALPADFLRSGESLDEAASRIARDSLGAAPSLLEQAITLGGARGTGEDGSIHVAYCGLAPDGGAAPGGPAWTSIAEIPPLPARQREEIDAALAEMRAHVDLEPIAFRLLPLSFTLTELQSVYELLLGRRLHKASFRRALHASALVEAIDEWRSEGRGRPAQLFRYEPPRRKRQRRGVRFDLLA